jgi:uncharacterized Zn finger protein
MSPFDPRLHSPFPRNIRTDCPECSGGLAILRIISGRAGSEYWTMRCTSCGGIHLNIINPRTPLPEHDNAPAA